MVYNINRLINSKMEDKQLTPQESMALISAMIQQSKHRVTMSNIRVSVMWGILTIVTAILVTVLLVTMRDPVYNYGWFAIPAIGIPLNILLMRNKEKPKVRTFIDTVNDTIWKTAGYVGLALCVACIIFNICGYPQAWLAMYYSAFILVGFGAVAMGAVMKEKSYIAGGAVSIAAGFGIIMVQLCGFTLLVSWLMPVYIVCFLLMFIVPAFIIHRKLKKSAE